MPPTRPGHKPTKMELLLAPTEPAGSLYGIIQISDGKNLALLAAALACQYLDLPTPELYHGKNMKMATLSIARQQELGNQKAPYAHTGQALATNMA